MALLLAASTAISALATTYHVPGQYPTIQSGIDAATAGDTVLVACGTYYEHDIVMKSGITLLSQTGEADCVTIDAQRELGQEGRVLYCENVDESTLIRGFTLTGGWVEGGGGGVYCGDGSSPTFESCVIRDNVGGFGGGMFCTNHSSPNLTGVTFEGNHALNPPHGEGPGGGLSCEESSSPRLTDCAFIGNGAFYGSGMLCSGSSPVLERVLFEYNSTSTTAMPGAAMACEGGTAMLIDVVFSRNSGWLHPALTLSTTAATLTRVTFIGNMGGYGASFWGCSPTVTGCTFYDNSYGLTCIDGASPILEQTIIAFNPGGAIYCQDPSSQPALECCDIFGNTGGDWVGCIEEQYGINGNISEDPVFCDPENGDFTLHEDSPCAPFSPPNEECDLIGAWPVECDGPTSVESTTWGRIKATYR
jgi:hypothetical protein